MSMHRRWIVAVHVSVAGLARNGARQGGVWGSGARSLDTRHLKDGETKIIGRWIENSACMHSSSSAQVNN